VGRGDRSGVAAEGLTAATSGDVAQLVAHLLCKQGVDGSSPFVSTTPDLRGCRI